VSEKVQTRSGRVLPAVLIVFVFATLVVWVVLASGGVGAPREFYDSFEVDGDTVIVTYSDSPCQTIERVVVDETDKEVTITVRTWTFALSCSEALLPYTTEVHLDAPLGDRSLVDGATDG
jgi:hypothetical protein